MSDLISTLKAIALAGAAPYLPEETVAKLSAEIAREAEGQTVPVEPLWGAWFPTVDGWDWHEARAASAEEFYQSTRGYSGLSNIVRGNIELVRP